MAKLHKAPTWEQNLVNAQVDVNRSVWAMNALKNEKERSAANKEYIRTHIQAAIDQLQWALEDLG